MFHTLPISLTVAYLPFVVMAAYAVAVDQADNGRMAFKLIPVGPAIAPLMMLRNWGGVPVPMADEPGGFALGIVLSLAIAVTLAWILSRAGFLVKFALILLATAAFSYCAYGTLMLIRM
jgi:hypothetical protein